MTDERSLAQRWSFYIGGDGHILRVDRRVKPSTAGEDVIGTLQELGAPKRTGRPATVSHPEGDRSQLKQGSRGGRPDEGLRETRAAVTAVGGGR